MMVKNQMKATASAFFLFLTVPVLHAAETAANYPTKTVRVIVPQAPGGGIDFMARQYSMKLSESLGQQFIVDNRTGAGSTIGTALVAKGTPDGYTLLVSSISTAFNASLYKNLPFDTVRDLAGVSLLARTPNVLVVNAAKGPKSVSELITLAKANAGKMNYGSGGVGGSDHVCTEYFLRTAGIKLTNVSYKGSAPALVELAAGATEMAFPPLASAMPLVKGGRLRALGVSTAKRTPFLPDVPTVAEAGLPKFEYSTWYGMWAPTGTPRAVLTKVNAETRKASGLPDVRERLSFQGAEPASASVDEFSAFFKAEVARWAPIIKDFSVPVD
jgi:tripartite-type tricarboxylate transporter receptor subunit TctC